jgi:uncharacterized protein
VAWLVADDKVLASAEIADGFRSRLKGLLGRDGITGVLVIEGARSVHSFGMRFPIDVAFCDGDMTVLRIVTLPRRRITRPCLRARWVIEAEAGALAHLDITVGRQLEIRR